MVSDLSERGTAQTRKGCTKTRLDNNLIHFVSSRTYVIRCRPRMDGKSDVMYGGLGRVSLIGLGIR